MDVPTQGSGTLATKADLYTHLTRPTTMILMHLLTFAALYFIPAFITSATIPLVVSAILLLLLNLTLTGIAAKRLVNHTFKSTSYAVSALLGFGISLILAFLILIVLIVGLRA